jgi:Cu(I)/Ag(I) efflux system membrane protein CusA/SilA
MAGKGKNMRLGLIIILAGVLLMVPRLSEAQEYGGSQSEHKAKSSTMKASMGMMQGNMGLTNAWTMPIKTRIDMLSTGIKTPVGIKLMGEDLQVLSDIGEKVEAVVREVPGTLSVYSERVTGGNFLDYKIKREEAARYGLTVGDVQDIIMTAIGGMNVTQTVEGLERYPVNMRYGSELRDTPEKLRRILVPTPTGAQVPITQVADIRIVKGPPSIKSENARNNAWIYVDLRGIDVGTYVKRAQQTVREKIKLPLVTAWSGVVSTNTWLGPRSG